MKCARGIYAGFAGHIGLILKQQSIINELDMHFFMTVPLFRPSGPNSTPIVSGGADLTLALPSGINFNAA